MKPAPLTLRRADSVDHALALLGDYGEDARVLAGGQSLMPLINLRLSRPALLVDLNGATELDYVRTADSSVRFGSLTRQRTLERDASTAKRVPLLAQAVKLIGHFQNRNRGTVGGSLAHADPAAELPTVAVALDAEMVIRGRDGTRTVDAKTFFQGPLTTTLEPGELLVEARFPTWGRASSFREVARRQGDFAIAAAGVALDVSDASVIQRAGIGLGGVGATPLKPWDAERLLVGERPSAELFAEAAALAASATRPRTDIHGTERYRRALTHTLVLDALKRAAEVPTT
jgi:carbon-monoxide dehydrogenase medium subunit